MADELRQVAPRQGTRPPPSLGEVNRFGEKWDGTRWTPGGGAGPAGLNLGPRPAATGPWDATDTKSMNEFLKQMFTLGGTAVGSALAGPAGSIGGGAGGRVVGSIPERLTAAAERRPSESSITED